LAWSLGASRQKYAVLFECSDLPRCTFTDTAATSVVIDRLQTVGEGDTID